MCKRVIIMCMKETKILIVLPFFSYIYKLYLDQNIECFNVKKMLNNAFLRYTFCEQVNIYIYVHKTLTIPIRTFSLSQRCTLYIFFKMITMLSTSSFFCFQLNRFWLNWVWVRIFIFNRDTYQIPFERC